MQRSKTETSLNTSSKMVVSELCRSNICYFKKADNQNVNKLVRRNEVLNRGCKSHQIFVSNIFYQYFEMSIKYLHAHHSLSI